MSIPKDLLGWLQTKQERVRNICILAHVDHGKTTLSDNLIASNGIISAKSIGDMRYLDSRDDEQERGITMTSSSISLLHVPGAHRRKGGVRALSVAEQSSTGYLVNLIDSPGHVDFCSEVSTAVRLSDGALVVVDAVEGVCIQTHAVLRQAWQEKVRPCLVINKIDRLVSEIRLDPSEAYARLRRIVDDANAVLSALQAAEFLKRADDHADDDPEANGADLEWFENDDDEEDVFHPGKGNVLFASAVDGWGFTVQQFAHLYSEKFGFSAKTLSRALWGPYCYLPKAKKIASIQKAGKNARPMFVQFVLDSVWRIYGALDPWNDGATTLAAVVKSQKLDVPDKVVNAGGRAGVQAVLRAWLPLGEAALSMAVAELPSPPEAAPTRMQHILSGLPSSAAHPALAPDVPPGAVAAEPSGPTERRAHVRDMVARAEAALSCSSAAPAAPVVVFVSKMMAVPAGALPVAPGGGPPANPSEEVFLGFGRVFSGILRVGQRVHVLSPAYDPANPSMHRQTAVVDSLFLMMGRQLERLEAVPAGNVLAVGGLQDVVLKTATLSSSPACPHLAPMSFQSAPIVQVAVEPALPNELPRLEAGLQLLNRADPCVEVTMTDTGEWVIGAAGEVHLETCIKDLGERFARVQLLVSPPLVNFRESVVHPAEVPPDAEYGIRDHGPAVAEARTPTGAIRVRVRAHPLPGRAATALEEHEPLLQALLGSSGRALEPALEDRLAGLQEALADAADSAKDGSLELFRRAWMLGPRKTGPNVLLYRASSHSLFDLPDAAVCRATKANAPHAPQTTELQDQGAHDDDDDNGADAAAAERVTLLDVGSKAAACALGLCEVAAQSARCCGDSAHVQRSIEAGITVGFQMAASAGPLCEDPLWGVAFDLEVAVSAPPGHAPPAEEVGGLLAALEVREDVYGPLQGQVMTAVGSACRKAVEQAGVRLVEAQYLVQVATSSQALAASVKVIKSRRGRILSEELREGMDLFIVQATMPVEACLSSQRGEAPREKDRDRDRDKEQPRLLSFADEMRRETSGAASVSLALSHWERLHVDPHWKSTTDEDREQHGEEATMGKNVARRLANAVRRRKGLALIGAKVVDDATKQRTRARKV